jgi:hypothetical protein
MKTFVRAVFTGFALSLGATLFRKLAKKVGLDDDAGNKTNVGIPTGVPVGATSPPAGSSPDGNRPVSDT